MFSLLMCFVCFQQPISSPDYRTKVFDLVNKLREAKGFIPLKKNNDLDRIAQDHADNLAKQDKIGDKGNPHILDGKTLVDRLSGFEFSKASENIQINQGHPESQVCAVAVKEWQKSEGHYRTLLGQAFTESGVGVRQGASGRWYVIQVFAAPLSK